jgi:hypothetical protein
MNRKLMSNSFFQLPLPTAPSTLQQAQRQDAALDVLNTCSLPQLLDLDNRPTFVLNMDQYSKGSRMPIMPVFCNAALREQEQLLSKVIGTSPSDSGPTSGGATHDEFRIWATIVSRFNDSRDIFPITIEFENLIWVGVSIHPNWRLISAHKPFQNGDIPEGDPLSASAPRLEKEGHSDPSADKARALASAEAIPTRDVVEDVQQP